MYISSDYRELLEKNGLERFDAVWDSETEWIETPNRNRGGWSGVGRIRLNSPVNDVMAYLKRQQNHTRRSLRHPIRGEPTLAREFSIIKRLMGNGVLTLRPMLFGMRELNGEQHAVLLTEELSGFQSLDQLLKNGAVQAMPLHKKRQLLAAIAELVRGMHDARVQHRSLYAKHIFVKYKSDSFDIAIIDFEKSRLSLIPALRMAADLVTLNYRTPFWTKTSRLFFYRRYLGRRLNTWDKLCLRYIISRSQKNVLNQKAKDGCNPNSAQCQR